jgi:AraC-like DNA-binding protein
VEAPSFPELAIHVERGRAALRVVARTAEQSREPILVEATYSGGPDGISLRLTQRGASRAFSRDAIARHPALSAVLRLIADEIDLAKPVSEPLLASLFQTILIYVGRLATAVPLPHWGRPLRDPRIEKALRLLNEDISKRWTVDLLARAVGISRPAFARQFQRALGLSPMRYLTQQRLQLAASLLLGTDAGLAEVAARVGYRSEFAFNRAFKRQHHAPPGVYRQQVPAARAYLAAA